MAARLRGRFRRRTLLLGVLVVALITGVSVLAVGARPSASAEGEVVVDAAHVGTAYAFDGVLCIASPVTSAEVAGVVVQQAAGGTTELVRAAEGPITLGFPVEPGGGRPVDGLSVPAGGEDCSLRLLVTPDRQGRVEAGRLDLRLRYGPGGLLRRTVVVRPAVALDVTATGPDPRAAGR